MLKKSIGSALLTIMSLFIFYACSNTDKEIEVPAGLNDPIASFSYSGNDGPAPVTIVFTNSSETIIADSAEYIWTFGENGQTSTEKNPIETFYNATNNAKVMLVTLEVRDLVSDRYQRRSQAITILPSK
ncbi:MULTISPECIES: PKD domain-containing protein [unclassified Lentimicrobium]|uniref:PKD domain-containing protein n=1 Tax=unclassified Lentimicrobium TaxID=2677434 RepID=UPI001551DF12|nr:MULTISPECIES: PKD domain-containing protein [unclassified Lentimicrobium]NPD46005.1 PKD domain-containing protein [Lentimicrobium sp. S6]NPD85205.1 PKD domain-containing protein [Lentimicrobium sp. L6]